MHYIQVSCICVPYTHSPAVFAAGASDVAADDASRAEEVVDLGALEEVVVDPSVSSGSSGSVDATTLAVV